MTRTGAGAYGIITNSSANWNQAYTDTNNATNANTASRIVKRDGSGNFSAGTITANLNGNATSATTATTAARPATTATTATTATNATQLGRQRRRHLSQRQRLRGQRHHDAHGCRDIQHNYQ